MSFTFLADRLNHTMFLKSRQYTTKATDPFFLYIYIYIQTIAKTALLGREHAVDYHRSSPRPKSDRLHDGTSYKANCNNVTHIPFYVVLIVFKKMDQNE